MTEPRFDIRDIPEVDEAMKKLEAEVVRLKEEVEALFQCNKASNHDLLIAMDHYKVADAVCEHQDSCTHHYCTGCNTAVALLKAWRETGK